MVPSLNDPANYRNLFKDKFKVPTAKELPFIYMRK